MMPHRKVSGPGSRRTIIGIGGREISVVPTPYSVCLSYLLVSSQTPALIVQSLCPKGVVCNCASTVKLCERCCASGTSWQISKLGCTEPPSPIRVRICWYQDIHRILWGLFTYFKVYNLGLYHQLRARRELSIFKDVPLRTRRVLSLYKVNGNSALLVLNRTSLDIDSALLALTWWYEHVLICILFGCSTG